MRTRISTQLRLIATLALLVGTGALTSAFVPVLTRNSCIPDLRISTPTVSGYEVTINGVVLYGPGCPDIERVHWDWGDGQENDDWFPGQHTYTSPGVYLVTVTAYDRENNTATETTQVSVGTSPSVEWAGQIGGATSAVAVQGDYAYVGIGPRLVILDISDPTHPILAGQTDTLPENVQDVVVMGNYAYVANRLHGLRIIDVSDPTAPIEVGFHLTWGDAHGVALAGNYAYVANGDSGLCIIDVSDPADPTFAGLHDTPGYARAVVVAGSNAYVADGYSGLRIVNVSTPATPTEVGFYDSPADAYGVAVAGNYAYVADNAGWVDGQYVEGSLRIINVSNPAAPTETSFYEENLRDAWDVVVVGNCAYVAGDQYGLRIIDVADPADPSEAGFYETPRAAQAVVVAGSYAYVADYDGGLRILDVTVPAAPAETGAYVGVGYALDVAMMGDYACVAEADGGLRIVDISDPASPTDAGSYTPATYGHSTAVSSHSLEGLSPMGGGLVSQLGVAVAGNYAYVADYHLRIVDVSNPAAPAEVGHYHSPDGARGYARDVAVVGNYAYVADGYGGLRVVDVSNPAVPTETGFLDTPDHAYGVTVAGKTAYVADADGGGLRVVDVSNPGAPSETGFHDTPGSAVGVAVAGSYAYVADGREGLRVINVSSPETPSETGFYDTEGYAAGVAVSGGCAYVTDRRDGGLYVIDVTNPPVLAGAGYFYTPGSAWNVAVVGNYVYVADGESGLVILRLLQDSVTGSVPTTGGSLSSTEEDTTLVFPNGAFTQTVTLTYRHLWTDQDTSPLVGIGHTFDVTAVYSDTGQPAHLAPGQTYAVTVHYTDAEKGPAIEDTLALYAWDGSQWLKELSSVVDPVAKTVTATPDHLSLWAVLGETRRVFLPFVLRGY